MAAKKKVVKTVITEKPKEKISVQYQPIFIPIVIIKNKKLDANYYGIKQYLKNKIGLDLFRKVNGNKEIKKENNFFNFLNMDWQGIKKFWSDYCEWWNNIFNMRK